jgi:hypothetical protein
LARQSSKSDLELCRALLGLIKNKNFFRGDTFLPAQAGFPIQGVTSKKVPKKKLSYNSFFSNYF